MPVITIPKRNVISEKIFNIKKQSAYISRADC